MEPPLTEVAISPLTSLPSFDELLRMIQEILQSGLVLLPIESGILNTGGATGWMSVSFQKVFVTAPSVVVQGEFRSGDYPQHTVDIPSITVPSILLPTISIPPVTIPNVTVPVIPYTIPRMDIKDILGGYSTIAAYMAQTNRASFLNATEGWQYIPVLSTVRLVLSGIAYGTGAFFGGFLDDFEGNYIRPQVTKVQDTLRAIKNKINIDVIGTTYNPNAGTINKAFDDIEIALQTAFDGVIGGVNASIEVIRDSAQDGFNTMKQGIDDSFSVTELAVEDAINNQIARLYEFLGILDGQPIVPTKVQNVTNIGFQLYSSGSDYRWIAIGM